MNDGNEVPDWLTEMDKEILEVLRSELVLTPSIIAENIDRSRKGVANRVNSLQAGELVTKVDRGKYKITHKGKEVWKSIDGSKYVRRRSQITNEKIIQHNLGVSLDEYQEAVEKEHQKIQNRDEDIKDHEDIFDLAFERAKERLREEN